MMALSESEEVGFKRIGLPASDYDSSLPIKKRRIPVVQSPPSPSKDISQDGNLMKTEQPSPSKDISQNGNLMKTEQSSPSKDISQYGNLMQTEQPSPSKDISRDGNLMKTEQSSPSKDISQDGNLMKSEQPSPPKDVSSFYTIENLRKSERPSPSVTIVSSSSTVTSSGLSNKNQDCVSEVKSLITEELTVHALPEIHGGSELSSTSLKSDPPAGNKEVEIDLKVGVAEVVSVGLKEHMNPKLVPVKSDLNFLKQNSLEPVLLDLSFNKQLSSTHCVKGNVGPDHDGSLQQSNRENWDLNTSMEFWEGYATDEPPVQPIGQTNTIVPAHRCSTELVRTDIPSGKLTPSDHGDNLYLSLSASNIRHLISQERSLLDFMKTYPFIGLPGRDMQVCDLNGALKVVKPEPFAEGSTLESKSDEVNVLGLSDGSAVKRELYGQCSFKIPNTLNICNPLDIVKTKSDSVYGNKQKALKILGGTLDLVAKEILPEVDNSCSIAMPFVEKMSEATRNSSCLNDLITNIDMTKHSELLTPTKVLGLTDVKRELDDQCSIEIPNALDNCTSMNIVKAKCESVYESEQTALKTLGGRLDLVAKEVLPGVDSSFPLAVPFVPEMSEASGNPSCSSDLITDIDMLNHSEMTNISEDLGSKDSSGPTIKPIVMSVATEMLEEARNPSSSTELIIDGGISNHSELLTPTEGPLIRKVHQGGYVCGGGFVKPEMTDVSKDPGSKDSSISAIKPKPSIIEDENQNIPQWHPLKVMNDQCSSLQGGEGSSVSDEEKISISADLFEEDPYSSEYESDGKQDVNEAMSALDSYIEDDYEDGEVREPILKTQVESSVCEKREVNLFYHGDRSNGLLRIDGSSLISSKQENESEFHDVKREDNFHSVTSNEFSEQEKMKEIPVEEITTGVCLNKAIKATGTGQLFQCEKIDALEDQEISFEKTTNGIEEPVVVKVTLSDAENVKTVDFVQNDNLALPNVKESINNDVVTDDLTHGSRDCQIVNPCQASTSYPNKTRSNLMRSVLTQTDREQIPEIAREEEKLHQGRDGPYSDVSQKFYVNRHQNLPPQTNFTRGRGRFTFRINSVQGEWDFNPGVYNDQMPPYDTRRRKYMPAVSDDDIDQNRHKIRPEGSFRNSGQRGRQIVDEGPPFCHISSRRRSPCRRDGPPIRGGRMGHKIPRNIIREPGSEWVGPRHGEKFVRTIEDETMDPIYAHPQPPFDVNRPPFIRDQRNFPIQRKSFTRVGSRSPGRSRGRSPGQWFPSKRKSDRFFGDPEMARRSPPGYRMRSPPPFDGDMPIRRHGFPFSPLPSNDMRDMGFPRDQDHMRPGIRGRNRNDRISFRNRRFEDMDPRERIEGDEYFDGLVHPGQLNELAGDDNDVDRRRFPERHEHLHPFQPQCNNSDGENYHNDVDEQPRHFRYCADDEPEFHDRGQLREREFDRRVKNNQQGNFPRRTGSIEEHEVEDYRHGRQLWNEHHGFEDISRMKSKRFG